jgi:hypothetical protein
LDRTITRCGRSHSDEIRRSIEAGFISNNLIKECVDRGAAGIVGLLPHWYLRSGESANINDPVSAEREPLLIEGEKFIQTWLDQMIKYAALGDDEKDSNPLMQAVTQMDVTGKGYLRLYQPRRYKGIRDTSLFNRIRLHCPPQGSVHLERDEDGEIEQITYSYGSGLETQRLDPKTGKLKFTVQRGKKEDAEEWISDFDGRWTIYELRSPPLITEDIKRLQNAINKSLTMLGRNLDLAGFLERVVTNAQLPGQWIDDPNRPGKQKFVSDDRGLQVGPGKTIFLSGIKTDGGFASPSISYRDPVDISTFDRSTALFATRMYLSFNQGHILASGDGSISGVSRVQLRQDSNLMADKRSQVVESAFANILEVVLRFLDPKFRKTYATTKLRKSLNYQTPEESQQIRANYQLRLISRTTAMSQLGIENPDAEVALIDEELAADAKAAALE